MNKVIKVAQVIGHAGAGGVESCILNYYRYIDRTKVKFDFLVESESEIINKEEIESLGGNVVIIPSYKNPFKYSKELKRIFKENQYDIVHSNMNVISVFSLRAAKKAGIKIRIAHSHSTSNPMEWKKNIIKNLLRPFSKKYSTNFFACSEHAGRWLFGNKTFDKGLVEIIYNAIDLKRFEYNDRYRMDIRNKYNITDKFVIGHAGRFVPQKNHDFLIDVFNELQKTRDDVVLLLIGDGPLENKINAKVKKYGIENKVFFAGVHKDIEKYYNAMDLFLFPSIYEGLGMTLVEAQVNGLPCVISKYIPKEAIISNSTKSLDLDILEWVNVLKFKHKRIFDKSFINTDNYNICTESEKLLLKYNSIMKH